MPADAETQPLGSFRLFTDHRSTVDSAVVLFMSAQAAATDARTIVDVGCGRGAMIDPGGRGRRMHDLRAPGRTVVGIDVDPAANDNPVIDEFRPIEDGRWPLADGEADLAVCDWVLEHIADPAAFVAELHRVLRPGGVFLARTVNRNSVLALGARAVPNPSHSRVLTRLQPGRHERDVFPTVYAMNTRRDLAGLLTPDFEWAVSYHSVLEQYAGRWPRLRGMVDGFESRLPRRVQSVLVVAARKR